MIDLALITALALASASPQATRPLYVEGQVLARLADGFATEAALSDLGVVVTPAQRGGWSVLVADRRSTELMAELRARGIAEVEPNYYVWTTATVDPMSGRWTPDDTYYPQQWNLVRMPQAWYYGRGSASVVVAVLDTGFHRGVTEQPLTLMTGRDIVNGDDDPDDDNGHGTHMGSIIAQSTDNALQAAGVAPEVALLPIKVLDAAGRGTVLDVARGIYFATDAGARVINLSLALPPGIVGSTVLHDAVTYAASRGVVLVAASGNHGAAAVSLPAAFNEVIAVGSLSSAMVVAPYSNYGAALDLVAPGGDSIDRDFDGYPDGIAAYSINPATRTEGLYLGAGTSQAAAHVSGAAALLLSLGESGRDRIRSLLALNTLPTASGNFGWTSMAGYGMLDVARAIQRRGETQTVPAAMLQGFIPNQKTAGSVTLENPILVLADHATGRVAVIRDSTGTYALSDLLPGHIALHRLHVPLASMILEGEGGILSMIDAAGSVQAFVASAGDSIDRFPYDGGLDALLDISGGLLSLLESSGGVLVIVDVSGGALALIDSAGGMLAMIESAGGMLAMIESAGGMLAMIESAGGMLAMIESAGGWMWLLESSGHDLSLLDGLQPRFLASDSGGRTRARRPEGAVHN